MLFKTIKRSIDMIDVYERLKDSIIGNYSLDKDNNNNNGRANNINNKYSESVILESLKYGRYSYIAFNPYLTFKSKGRNILINDAKINGNPLTELKKLLKKEKRRLKIKKNHTLPLFQSGSI